MWDWLSGRRRQRSMPSLSTLGRYDPRRYGAHAEDFATLMLRFWNCDPELAENEWERAVEEFVKDGLELPAAVHDAYSHYLLVLLERRGSLPDCE